MRNRLSRSTRCDLFNYESYPRLGRGIQGSRQPFSTKRLDPRGLGSDAEEAISKKKQLSKKVRSAMYGALTETETRKPAVTVRDYDSHVLVCAGGDCKKRGSKQIRKAFKGKLRASGILGDVRIDTVDCFGQCKHGPNVLIYDGAEPRGAWYLGLAETDVSEVVEQHLKGGAPVERLAADRHPRKAKKARK
jgi:(2Fe-2S) ferredoxin